MQFLNLLCHPEAIQALEGKTFYCTLCNKNVIENIVEYVNQPFEDHFMSSRLAQAYSEWSGGNDQIPMTFPVIDLEGILSKRVVGQTLAHVRESIQLLRFINAPFTTEPHGPQLYPEMKRFMTHYLQSVLQHQSPAPEHQILHKLVQAMKQTIQSEEFANPFEFYIHKLVPFTQACVSKWTPLPAMPEDPNVAKELLIQLQRSDMIRRVFGMYSIPFDVIHTLVASYSCSSDLEMIGNWVMDLMARVCRGRYFWKQYPECLFVKRMHHVLNTEVTRRNHMPLVRTLQHIRQGNAADGLSAFWPHYVQLNGLVNEKYHVPQIPQDILQIACTQMFPAVLFEKHGDQLGFTMALIHLIVSVDPKTGRVQKGAFKKARQIHEMVQTFVDSVQRFESSTTTPQMIWTLDTLRMFLVSEPDLETQITAAIKMVLTEEEE